MMNDLISRQTVLDIVDDLRDRMTVEGYCAMVERVKALSPAKPVDKDLDVPVKDCISRQQAIDAIRAMQTYKMFAGDDLILVDQAGAMMELMMLPSEQPEHSEGLYVDGYNDGYRDGMKDAQPNIEEDEDIPMEYFENGGI